MKISRLRELVETIASKAVKEASTNKNEFPVEEKKTNPVKEKRTNPVEFVGRVGKREEKKKQSESFVKTEIIFGDISARDISHVELAGRIEEEKKINPVKI